MRSDTNYWADIDVRLEAFQDKGFCKLPSVEHLIDAKTVRGILDDMKNNTFQELGRHHERFLQQLEIQTFLVPKLYDIALKKFGYQGSAADQYHIARSVRPGDPKEKYRAHFDSHLFTLVLPVSIPKRPSEGEKVGELLFFPNARNHPKTEISNFLGKVYFKSFASKTRFERYALKQDFIECDFFDNEPLLFFGHTTLHTNREVSEHCRSPRLTLLAHFFDPSPTWGIGSFLRAVRNR